MLQFLSTKSIFLYSSKNVRKRAVVELSHLVTMNGEGKQKASAQLKGIFTLNGNATEAIHRRQLSS